MTRLLFVLALLTTPALAQQRPAPQPAKPAAEQPFLPRPAWAAAIPEAAPDETIGLTANMPSRSDGGRCRLQLQLSNATTETIRYVYLKLEVFFAARSVIETAAFQFVDPGKSRVAEINIFATCPTAPTKMVVREVSLCTHGSEQFRRGCAVPMVPVVPAFRWKMNLFPVEIAPDAEGF